MENHLIILLSFIGLAASVFLVLFIVGIANPQSLHCKSRIEVFWCYGTFLFASMAAETMLVNAYVSYITPYRVETLYSLSAKQYTTPSRPKRKARNIVTQGQAVKVDYLSYTIRNHSYRRMVGVSEYGLDATADGIYLIVNISITNLDDEPCMFPMENFYVTDKDRASYSFKRYETILLKSETDYGIGCLYEALDGKKFQPNVPTKEILLFEVPQRGEYYLHFAGGSTAVLLE